MKVRCPAYGISNLSPGCVTFLIKLQSLNDYGTEDSASTERRTFSFFRGFFVSSLIKKTYINIGEPGIARTQNSCNNTCTWFVGVSEDFVLLNFLVKRFFFFNNTL